MKNVKVIVPSRFSSRSKTARTAPLVHWFKRQATHGYGNLDLNTFQPFPKNPAISKVFREIGLADELGSGMRNTRKYTKMYSGGVPQFVQGDIFRTVIPLNDAATLKSGPKVSEQVSDQDNSIVLEREILKFCRKLKSKKEIEVCQHDVLKKISEHSQLRLSHRNSFVVYQTWHKSSLVCWFLVNSIIPNGTGLCLFLAEILNFQGSTHRIGVGSLSH